MDDLERQALDRCYEQRAVVALASCDHLARFEAWADLYHARFGQLSPGKSDPLADSNSEENRALCAAWHASGLAAHDAIMRVVTLTARAEAAEQERDVLQSIVDSSVPPIPWVDVVLDGGAGPVSGRFVETEGPYEVGVGIGEWIDRGNGLWALRIPLAGPDHVRVDAERKRAEAAERERDEARAALAEARDEMRDLDECWSEVALERAEARRERDEARALAWTTKGAIERFLAFDGEAVQGGCGQWARVDAMSQAAESVPAEWIPPDEEPAEAGEEVSE